MKPEYVKDVEAVLEHYFPAKWSAGDIDKIIGKARFIRDDKALQQVLNVPIRNFIFRGGKRLRPALFLLLLAGFGVKAEKYKAVVLLIELVHNGTLVIDDIEDDSLIRRGSATLHKQYGIDVAVNAGMVMHFLPLVILSRATKEMPDDVRLKIYELYSEELNKLYFGQGLDINWHSNLKDSIDVQKYMEMTRLKTGSLMRLCVRTACIIGDQSKKVERGLQHYAESAGVAFQIRDDVLDLTGDQKNFGKAFGNDITEGKISLPVILALQNLDEAERARLLEILRLHSRENKLIKEARELIRSTGATQQALALAANLLEQAWNDAKDVIPAGDCRQALQDITLSFIKREK